MTKSVSLKIFSLILALFVAIYATGTVFAWFSSQYWNMDITGNTPGAYFAYGDGTDTKMTNDENPVPWDGKDKSKWDMNTGPFGIDLPTHMYNLAWLQNTGRFEDRKYYFELAADVNMWDSATNKNVVLPPIGNTAYPFDGVFEGNGYTISNLVISTNKNVLEGTTAGDDYEFSNAVGFFGMTSETSEIKNFILDYPTVEVADESGLTLNADTKYSEIEPPENEDDDPTDMLAAGLAVGYVKGKVQSIGVKGGTLAVRKSGYTTFNSILGTLSDNALKDNTVTGTVGGSGNQFGANFDVDGIWARMKMIYENGGIAHRLPNVSQFTDDNGDTGYSLAKLEKMPFTITSASTYTGVNASEIVSVNNIGYILGDENKVFSDTVKFGEPLVEINSNYQFPDGTTPSTKGSDGLYTIPKWFYKPTTEWGNSTGYGTWAIAPLTETEYDAVPDEIKDYIFSPNSDGSYTLDSIQLGGEFTITSIMVSSNGSTSKNSGNWSPHGLIEWNGGIYGSAYERNGYAADENGNYYVGTKGTRKDGSWGWILTDATTENIVNGSSVPIDEYEDGIALPNNGIWFNPVNLGTIRMIVYVDSPGGVQFMKIQRPKAYATEDNPFMINWAKGHNGANSDTGDITIVSGTQHNYVMAANILYYFEFEVSQADLDAGYEYWICKANTNGDGAKFVYLDIGSSGSIDDGIGTDQAVPTKKVTAIDFIYNGVTILDHDITDENGNVLISKGSFVTKNGETYTIYVETRTMLTFGSSSAIVAFYYRDSNQNGNPTIYAAHNGNTIVSSNSSKATITTTGKDVDVKGDLQMVVISDGGTSTPTDKAWTP